MLELKRGGRNRVQTEMVVVPVLKKLYICLVISRRSRAVVQGQQRNAQKKRDAGTELLFCKSKPIAF